jgi:hypothetical protein
MLVPKRIFGIEPKSRMIKGREGQEAEREWNCWGGETGKKRNILLTNSGADAVASRPDASLWLYRERLWGWSKGPFRPKPVQSWGLSRKRRL